MQATYVNPFKKWKNVETKSTREQSLELIQIKSIAVASYYSGEKGHQERRWPGVTWGT